MLWYAYERFLTVSMADHGRAKGSLREHYEIVSLLAKRDLTGLTELMCAHVKAGCEHALRQLERSPPLASPSESGDSVNAADVRRDG